VEELLKDLVSLADFDREDAPLHDQVMAVYFSKTVAVFGGLQFLLMMEWSLSGHEFWKALWLCLGISIIGGVLFAGLMYVTTVPSLRRKLRARLTRVWNNELADDLARVLRHGGDTMDDSAPVHVVLEGAHRDGDRRIAEQDV
jgi:hypothetical protein